MNLKASKKKLIGNFLSLSSLEGFNYLCSLIIIPYLIKTCTSANYGLISFAAALNQYFVTLTNFGFHISAVKMAAIHRNNEKELSAIFSCVLVIKLILFLLCFGCLLALISLVPKFQEHSLLFMFSFGAVLDNILSSVWFFQGMEAMKYITVLKLLTTGFSFLGILIFVKQPEDFILVPLIQTTGILVSGILANYIIVRRFHVRLTKPHMHQIISLFKESLPFFLSRLSIVLYTSTNQIIIGSYINMTSLAYYTLADKVVRALRAPLNIVNQVIYPHLSYTKDKKFTRKILHLTSPISWIIYVIIFIFAGPIVLFLGGEEVYPAENLLRILAIGNIFYNVNLIQGVSVLVVWGKSRYFNASVNYSVLLYMAMVSALFMLDGVNTTNLAWCVVITQLFILMYRSVFIKKYALLDDEE